MPVKDEFRLELIHPDKNELIIHGFEFPPTTLDDVPFNERIP